MDRENILNNNNTIESQNSIGDVTKRILKTDGNSIKLSLLTLCFAMVFFAVLVFCTLPAVFSDVWAGEEPSIVSSLCYMISGLAIFPGSIFLILPLASGIMYFAMLTVLGSKPYFWDVMQPFEKGLYFRSIAAQGIIFVRILIIGMPLVGGLSYISLIFANYNEISFFFLAIDLAFVICTTVAATVVAACFSSFFFFAPYLIIAQNKGVFASLAESFRMSRGRHTEIIKMTARGIFDLILSAISFMVLFVIYAMPRMTVSYFVYCNGIFAPDNITIE